MSSEAIQKVEMFVKGLCATGMSVTSIKEQVLDKFCTDIDDQKPLLKIVDRVVAAERKTVRDVLEEEGAFANTATSAKIMRQLSDDGISMVQESEKTMSAIEVRLEDSITRKYEDDPQHRFARVHVGYVVNGKFWPNEAVLNPKFAEELCDMQHRERHKGFSWEPPKASDMFELHFTSGRELTMSEQNSLAGFGLKLLSRGDCHSRDHVYGVNLRTMDDFKKLAEAFRKSIILDTNSRLEIIDDYRE